MALETPTGHRTHAVLDVESRRRKAAKIARLLGLDDRSVSLRILEVGCGSGAISRELATMSPGHKVDAVDTVDTRVVTDGYRFHLVTGAELPFDAETFDIVISNHVIEHVGPMPTQRHHVAEIHRVLRRGGTGYLAVPNRWRLVEPHYRLPALSVWPRAWRTPYLRMLRGGEEYDCEPLGAWTLERMLKEAGFHATRLGVEALRATLDLEHPGSLPTRMVHRAPSAMLRPFEPALPTLIYRLSKA